MSISIYLEKQFQFTYKTDLNLPEIWFWFQLTMNVSVWLLLPFGFCLTMNELKIILGYKIYNLYLNMNAVLRVQEYELFKCIQMK